VGVFGDAVDAALKDQTVGYVLRLRQHGNDILTRKRHWAKTPIDNSEHWSPDVRMHIASCSKLMTAMAMTRLLRHKEISFDAPIINYLPDYWQKGPNVASISFRNLMTHTSGFNTGSSASDYLFMKQKVAAGVPAVGNYHYENMNFGLCRILISTIHGDIDPSQTFLDFTDLIWDLVTIDAYKRYVRKRVFHPAGVTGPTLTHPAADALAYTFPPGDGWNSGDLSTMSGAAGWHMSVDDMLTVMGSFRRDGTIMSTAHAQQMLDDEFGIDVRTSTPLGILYNKNGGWSSGSGQTEQSLAYFLPEDMELAVLANSPVGINNQFFRDVISNIYSNSIA
jgi:CubicO group peptidase (beta-lactamase class C family)